MERQQPTLCPSARCKEGAILLGIVLPNNTIAYADRRLKLDAGQAQEMQQGNIAPEKRFRFSSPCAQCACQQWRPDGSSGKCGVIEEVLAAPPSLSLPRVLPDCAIRPQCRWFVQRGEHACAVCRYVITDGAVMSEQEASLLLV